MAMTMVAAAVGVVIVAHAMMVMVALGMMVIAVLGMGKKMEMAKSTRAEIVPIHDSRLCSAATRAEINLNAGRPQDKLRSCAGIGAWAAPVAQQSALKRMPASCDPSE